jgi:hypothetical protein
LWSLIQALYDTEGKGNDPKGLVARISYAVAGFSYAALAYAALNLVMGRSNTGKSSDQNAQDWTAELLKQPFGTALVIILGLIVLGIAGVEFYRAYKASFQKHLESAQMSANTKRFTLAFGRFGLLARGFVFGVIGIFFIVAAMQQNASQAKGLGGALQEVAAQPYGQILLGLVGLGLIAYGLYSFVEARYRHIARV